MCKPKSCQDAVTGCLRNALWHLTQWSSISGQMISCSVLIPAALRPPLPIVGLLGALMRRAAPTRPRLSALASGIAAGACGAVVFAFCCPFNDPLYVVVGILSGAPPWRPLHDGTCHDASASSPT